jgi:hypothetical protein
MSQANVEVLRTAYAQAGARGSTVRNSHIAATAAARLGTIAGTGDGVGAHREPTEGKDDIGKRWAMVIGVAAAGVMALGAPPASATFPGTDGRIE